MTISKPMHAFPNAIVFKPWVGPKFNPGGKIARECHEWTSEEYAILKKHYPKVGARCASLLKGLCPKPRTKAAIKNAAFRLELKCENRNKPEYYAEIES